MNLDFDLFTIEKSKLLPAVGKVLIAEPFMGDVYFKRSVVLLTEHGENGSVGFILNKPVSVPFNEVVTNFPSINMPIAIGGPVANNSLHFVHTLGDFIPESIKIADGIYWGGDFEFVRNLVEQDAISDTQIRFFLGYAGWQIDQLEEELTESSWVVADADVELIMKIGEADIWKQHLKSLGGKYTIWSDFPENPSMN